MIRIFILYTATILVLGLLIPFQDPTYMNLSHYDVLTSPFTKIFGDLGILSAGASIVNFIILLAVFSSANSSMYAASRTIMSLADQGMAPSIFSSISRNGVPTKALLMSVLFSFIAFIGSFVGNGIVFDYLLRLTGQSFLITWMAINFVHFRFRDAFFAQGHSLDELNYVARFYP